MGLLNKIWSGLDFRDKDENRRQREQFAKDDEEERRRRAVQKAARARMAPPVNNPITNALEKVRNDTEADLDTPLEKVGSQSKLNAQAPRTPAPQEDFLKLRQGEEKNKTILGWNAAALLPKSLEKRRVVTADAQSRTDKDTYLKGYDNISPEYQEILVNEARKKAEKGDAASSNTLRVLTEAGRVVEGRGRKKGFLEDPTSGAKSAALSAGRVGTGTVQGLAGLYDLATPGKGTNRVSQASDKVAKELDARAKETGVEPLYKAGNVAGEAALFFGTGGSSAVAKGSTTATKYGTKVDELAKVIEEGGKAGKLRQFFSGGVKQALSPSELIEEIGYATKQTGEQASKGEDVNPASVAKNIGTGIGGNAVFGALTKGFNKLREADNVVDDALGAAEEEAPNIPGRVEDKAEAIETPKVEVAQGVGSTNLAKIPEPEATSVPPASAAQIPGQAIQDVPSPQVGFNVPDAGASLDKVTPELSAMEVPEVPIARFRDAENGSLEKVAPPPQAPEVPIVQPTQADIAEAAVQGERLAPELDAAGNPALVSDAQAAQDLADAGVAPVRAPSPVASAEDALQRAAAKAAEDEVTMAAPRTRAEGVDLIQNESARLDVAETFKGRDVVDIADTQAQATMAVRELSDETLAAKYSQEPEIKTPQEFFESVAAVERLGRLDPSDPVAVRSLTNALDGLSSFSSRAGRDLRMVRELFANLPPAMRKGYLIDRIESKLGSELDDVTRAELLGKIEAADAIQEQIDGVVGRLEDAKKNLEIGAPVDEDLVAADIENFRTLTAEHEYQQGDAFQFSQDLLADATAGARVAQATKTAMLSSPLRRVADVVTTGLASASDTASNAISGVIGRGLNKVTGDAGKFRETRLEDYGALLKGNVSGLKDSAESVVGDRRKVSDIMGELQRATRADANGAVRTRGGRLVGDLTEAATNSTQGQYAQKIRELARQEGQKIGLEGDELSLYTRITEKIPDEVSKHEAQQYHLRTNNLHDNKLNTVFKSVAAAIEKQFPQGGPIFTTLTVPFKSYQAGNLNRLFTDKTVLGNAGQLVKAIQRGDQQGMIDAVSKGAVNTGETLVLGSLLSSAGLLKDTNDNGEDFAGPYLQTPFGDIPVGFFGPSGLNMTVGHNLSKLGDDGDIDGFVNNFGKQAISFMNIEGSLGGDTPLQNVISGQGDVGDRAVKFVGDTIRRPIPSALGDVNAVANTATGQDKAQIKSLNEDGTINYLATEGNRTLDKLGLSSLLDREEGKSSQGIIQRITGGTRSTEGTREAEVERGTQQSLKDAEKQLEEFGVPLKDDDIKTAIEDGNYDEALVGLQFKRAKAEADPNTSKKDLARMDREIEKTTLESQGISTSEEGMKARMEDGEYDKVSRALEFKLAGIEDDPNVARSTKDELRSKIGRTQIYSDGAYEPDLVNAYEKKESRDGGIGVTEWREMMESGDPVAVAYATRLQELDNQLVDGKLIDKPKYYWKGGGKGRGKGGGKGGASKLTTQIGTLDAPSAKFSPIKAQTATLGPRERAIPVLAKVPNYDRSKLKKISVTKGGRA